GAAGGVCETGLVGSSEGVAMMSAQPSTPNVNPVAPAAAGMGVSRRSGPGEPAPPVRRPFARGALIYAQGDTATALYRLESGEVKLYALTPGGLAVSITYIRPGQTFGEEALVGVTARALHAEAVVQSRVQVIGPARLASWSRRPEALLGLTRALW